MEVKSCMRLWKTAFREFKKFYLGQIVAQTGLELNGTKTWASITCPKYFTAFKQSSEPQLCVPGCKTFT